MQAQLDHGPWAIPGGDRSSWSMFDPLQPSYGSLHAKPLPSVAPLAAPTALPGAAAGQAAAPSPAGECTFAAAKLQPNVEGDGQLNSPPASNDGKLPNAAMLAAVSFVVRAALSYSANSFRGPQQWTSMMNHSKPGRHGLGTCACFLMLS